MLHALILAGITNGYDVDRGTINESLRDLFNVLFPRLLASNVAAMEEQVTSRGDWRRLTAGEISLAVNSGLVIANVGDVRVYNGYILSSEIVAFDGNIHIGKNNRSKLGWSEDYSRESVRDQSVLLHELFHVYDNRTLGCNAACMIGRRATNGNYDYTIEEGKSFYDYGLEEQAEMVQDKFLLQNGLSHWRSNTSTLTQLQGVIPF